MLRVLADDTQGLQYLRHFDGLEVFGQDTDRAQRPRLAHVKLSLLRRVHHDRDRRGQRVVLDRGDGLQAVHARHFVIHEDDVRTETAQVLECLLRRFRGDDLEIMRLEHLLQHDPCGP